MPVPSLSRTSRAAPVGGPARSRSSSWSRRVVGGAVMAAGSFASAAGPVHTITVESGQTMSQLAAERLPDLSIQDGVVAIQLANGLSTPQIHVGQQLVIPAG